MQACKWAALIFVFLVQLTVIAQSPTLVLQKGSFQSIKSIAFNKSGRQIITTAGEGTLKIWEPFSQRLLQELDGGGNSFNAAWFAGNYVVAPSQIEDGSTVGLNVWNTQTGRMVKNDRSAKLSPNGQWTVKHQPPVMKTDKNFHEYAVRKYPIDIYSTASGQLFRSISRFINNEDDPFLFNFLSDSCLLLAQKSRLASGKGNVTSFHVYNFITDKELASFADSSLKPKGSEIQISNTGKYFLRTVNRVTDISDPNTEYSSADSVYTELWNIAEGKMIMRTQQVIADAIFSDNDASLALTFDVVWDTNPSLDAEWPPFGHVDWISFGNKTRTSFPASNWCKNTVPVFSRDGKYMALAVTDTVAQHSQGLLPAQPGYHINVYDEASALFSSLPLKKMPAAMVFDPGGQYLVTGYEDGNFSAWELTPGFATSIAAVQNEVDPLLYLHADDARNEIFYTTRQMYGKHTVQTVDKIAAVSTDALGTEQQHFLLNGRYSLLVQPFSGSYAGRLMLVNNDSPSVIKTVRYQWGKNVAMFMESISADSSFKPAGSHMMTASLNNGDLQSLSFYSTSVDSSAVSRFWRLDRLPLPAGLIFAVVRSRHISDTVLLFTTLNDIMPNKKLMGYSLLGAGNYILSAKDSKLRSLANGVKLMQPVFSDDGNALIGPKCNDQMEVQLSGVLRKDPLINSDKFLYCLNLANQVKFRTPVEFKNDVIAQPGRFVFSPNGKTAVILASSYYSAAGFVRVINAVSGSPIYNLPIGNSSGISGVEYTKDSRFLYAWSAAGICIKWDLTTGKEIYSMVFFEDHDYAIILPNGYYYVSSKTDARLLNFKLNGRYYNFSQFDFQFNRPDKVLQAIGNRDKALIDEYYRAWLNRIGKAGFKEKEVNNLSLHVPQVSLVADSIPGSTRQKELKLTARFSDSLFNIRSYNVFINDVPLHGINGTAITDPVKQLQITTAVLLSQGRNKIELTCTNVKGVESRRETVYSNYQPAQKQAAKTYFIGIGINQYSRQSSFVDLSYCVKDIRDLSIAFSNKYKNDLVIDTLMNDNASKENILALREKLMQTQVDDKVIISFSGHGMVDPQHPGDFYFATGKTQANNPAVNGLSYAQLEELLDSIPARKKLMLLDACHSGESNDEAGSNINRIPGTKRGLEEDKISNTGTGSIEILDVVENAGPARTSSTDIFKLMKDAFVDIRRNNGAYVLSAAQSNESAGEGGGISNGWFSSCLIEQLHQHGNITVNELSTKVNKCVSAKSGGNQNTDNRQELAEFNWQLW